MARTSHGCLRSPFSRAQFAIDTSRGSAHGSGALQLAMAEVGLGAIPNPWWRPEERRVQHRRGLQRHSRVAWQTLEHLLGGARCCVPQPIDCTHRLRAHAMALLCMCERRLHSEGAAGDNLSAANSTSPQPVFHTTQSSMFVFGHECKRIRDSGVNC